MQKNEKHLRIATFKQFLENIFSLIKILAKNKKKGLKNQFSIRSKNRSNKSIKDQRIFAFQAEMSGLRMMLIFWNKKFNYVI